MPTITALSIISKAELLTQDTTNIRWARDEWLVWMNDAQREIQISSASAFTRTQSIPLVAGTRQSLPADGINFIDYICSMGAGGNTPGSAARKVPKSVLDSNTPNWHSSAPSAVPQHFVCDPLDPKTFYVYPASTGGTFARVLYSASLPVLATINDVIGLDDVYANVILDYLLYRAYSKDSDSVGNAERSLLYRKAFENSIGIKTAVDSTTVKPINIKG